MCRYKVDEVQHPQCVVCTEVFANESLKPIKMLRHLKTKHSCLAEKTGLKGLSSNEYIHSSLNYNIPFQFQCPQTLLIPLV